jgi:hypothetical protein
VYSRATTSAIADRPLAAGFFPVGAISKALKSVSKSVAVGLIVAIESNWGIETYLGDEGISRCLSERSGHWASQNFEGRELAILLEFWLCGRAGRKIRLAYQKR